MCSITETVIVPPAPPFFIQSLVVTPVTCAGSADASITVYSSGGLAPVLYTLYNITTTPGTVTAGPQASNVFTAIASGTYFVVANDANTPSCSAYTANFTIANPSGVLINSVTPVLPLCANQAGGKIIISAMGGTGTLQYSIDGGFTFSTRNEFDNLAAGTYSIVVKDGEGCTTTDIFVLQQPAALLIQSIVKTNVTTAGGSGAMITITATGGTGQLVYSIDAGNTFTTNNVFTGLTAGTYYIVVKDANGCTATGTVSISQPSPLVVTANASPSGYVPSGTIVVTASGGTPPYLYSINGGPFKAQPVFSNLGPGTYSITVQDANGATATTTAQVTSTCCARRG